MTKRGEYSDKDMFRVPDNYFEDLTSGLMERVQPEVNRRKSGLFSIIKPHIMLAASMVGLVIISYTALKLLLPPEHNNGITGTSLEITDYLVNELDEITLLEKLTDPGVVYEKSELVMSHLSSDEIIDYLVDEDIDYNDIFEKL